MHQIEHTMMWRRFDHPGLDAAYFGRSRSGWRLCGTAIFAGDAGPCHLGYAVDADERWRTRSAHVFGTIGASLVDIRIAASTDRTWTLGSRAQPDAAGCIDLDLGFTTAPRLFTLRRLALHDGQETVVPVASLDLSAMEVGRVTESYLRLHERAFRFSSTAGGPPTVLGVGAHLEVLRYPGRWDSESFPARDARSGSVAAHRRPASRPDYHSTSPANTEPMCATGSDGAGE